MTSDKLLKTIKLIVQNELKKTLKPLLKEVLKPIIQEQVEIKLNAILAEKFIQNLSSGTPLISEQTKSEPAPMKKQTIKEDRRKELLKKLGADENPMAALIYGDVDMSQNMDPVSGGSIMLANGEMYDPQGDDDGIDISQFGL